jgi:hypothetical protein
MQYAIQDAVCGCNLVNIVHTVRVRDWLFAPLFAPLAGNAVLLAPM